MSTIQDAPAVQQLAGEKTSGAWAIAGIAGAASSFAAVALSMMLSPEYVEGAQITAERISEELIAKTPILIAFHVLALAAAMLNIVFAAGLRRRLRDALGPRSLVPFVAFAGMLLVAVAQMMGTGLDTEFLFGADDPSFFLPSDVGLYSHWVATIPWVWFGGGIAGIAVAAASVTPQNPERSVPTWISMTGWLLGGLTLLVALSPLQYLAVLPGTIWLGLTALGFAAFDRRA